MALIEGLKATGIEPGGDHHRFLSLALTNPKLAALLKTLPELGVDDCWVVSGCLVQSVWNALCGREPDHGIVDYDIIYFDFDTAWDAEDRVIRRADALFAGLGAPVQVRNQARVHLWYNQKFAKRVAPLRTACQSLWRYPSRTTAIAVGMDRERGLDIVAPFGVKHALNLHIRPNRRVHQPDAYRQKARRWQDAWPELRIAPW